jgi:hypothetical protein
MVTPARVNRGRDERRDPVCYNQQLIADLMQKTDALKRGHLRWQHIPVSLP